MRISHSQWTCVSSLMQQTMQATVIMQIMLHATCKANTANSDKHRKARMAVVSTSLCMPEIYSSSTWNHSQLSHLLCSLVWLGHQNSVPASLLLQTRVGRGWASHELPPLSVLKRGVSVCPDH